MAPGFESESQLGVEDSVSSSLSSTLSSARGPESGSESTQGASELPRIKAVHPASLGEERRTGGSHLIELDGLRGVAILMVLVFHFIGVMPAELSSRSEFSKLFARLAVSGWCGVDLFFVLSGFLITGILYDTKAARRYYLTFYARRALRIFPLYYGVLVALFVIAPVFLHPDADFRRLLDRQGWFWLYGVNLLRVLQGAQSCTVGNLSFEHFWSLAVEEHFYLIWPIVVFSLGRVAVMKICGFLAVAAILTRWYFAQSSPFAAYMLTPCRIDALAMGGLLALAIRGGASSHVKATARVALVISGLALAVLLARGHGLLLLSDRVVQVFGYSLLAVFFTSSVALAIDASPRSRFAAALRSRPLIFFGKYSYGIYIYHFLIFTWLRSALPLDTLARVVGPGFPSVLAHVMICLCLTVAVSWMSWQVYERHFVAAKKYFPYR
jgi:peptidoglycan/LPS O-acetylase OafA/YrhL